jgi:hypothetical protein
MDVGLLSAAEAQPIWRRYSRQGFKKREPLDDEIPVETPRLIKESFKAIIKNKICDNSDILLSLKLPREDIEEISSLERNFLSDDIAEIYNFSLKTTALNDIKEKNLNTARVFQFPIKDPEN